MDTKAKMTTKDIRHIAKHLREWCNCANVKSVCGPDAVCDQHRAAALLDTLPAALVEALRDIARGLTDGQYARGETFESLARAALAKAGIEE